MKNIAVNLLTYNGEDFIEYAFESVVPFAEEILVYDSGSKDSTYAILERLKKKYEKLRIFRKDVQHLGETWTDSPKDKELTAMLNNLKSWTKSEWILKIDDDEIFPNKLMQEIIELEPVYPIYSIPFIHIGIAPKKNMIIKRLFQNISEVSWRGSYGVETLCLNGSRLSSRKCPRLNQSFIHLGGLRKSLNDRRHDYAY